MIKSGARNNPPIKIANNGGLRKFLEHTIIIPYIYFLAKRVLN